MRAGTPRSPRALLGTLLVLRCALLLGTAQG